ncbi:unnamed protein product [Adineta ricciae]|uniref:UBC core domain-containing protein n=1 Tax=Adineta ricciae TaxID=249248 RepID=A0A815QEY7_ADIRI|nr:unnamed protein product [Adineta ricciae]
MTTCAAWYNNQSKIQKTVLYDFVLHIMFGSRLNKELYFQITKLKLCQDAKSDVKFVLESSPFDNDDDDDDDNEKITGASSNCPTIIGRIFPNSSVYREGSFRIEITLPTMYPSDPPEIRFLTPIYHISVADDGRLSSETVKRDLLWSPRRSLVEIIRALVDYIDHPNLQFILNHGMGGEFMYNRAEFEQSFTVTFEAQSKTWRLKLQPLASYINSFVIVLHITSEDNLFNVDVVQSLLVSGVFIYI